MPVILFIFYLLLLISTVQHLLAEIIFAIYLQKNYGKLCDNKTVKTKARKTVLGDRSFQESVDILFYIQQNAFQKETFESIFHTYLEEQGKVRDLWLQTVSNGCQIDSLIPNAWINGIVINAFLKEARKTSSYSNAVFFTDIFQNIPGGRLNQEYQNVLAIFCKEIL